MWVRRTQVEPGWAFHTVITSVKLHCNDEKIVLESEFCHIRSLWKAHGMSTLTSGQLHRLEVDICPHRRAYTHPRSSCCDCLLNSCSRNISGWGTGHAHKLPCHLWLTLYSYAACLKATVLLIQHLWYHLQLDVELKPFHVDCPQT